MIFTQKFRFFTMPLLAACIVMVFLLSDGKLDTYVRFPLVLSLFLFTVVYSPLPLIFNQSTKIENRRDKILVNISQLLMFTMTCMIVVLVFSTSDLTISTSSIIATISSAFIAVLLVYKNEYIRYTLIEHWIVTIMFTGLVIFLK